jgi:hypothetical protein
MTSGPGDSAQGRGEAVRRPPWVQTPAQRERWRLCDAIAREALGPDAGAGELWSAVRALYRSDIPTRG